MLRQHQLAPAQVLKLLQDAALVHLQYRGDDGRRKGAAAEEMKDAQARPV
jgi:hypothetical protein